MPKLTEETDKVSPVQVKAILDRLWKLAEKYVGLGKEKGRRGRLQTAFLYTTRTGLMKAFGSPALVKCLEGNQVSGRPCQRHNASVIRYTTRVHVFFVG